MADARFCFRLPDQYSDVDAAPLLCAGMIGYRSYRKTGDARRLGIYGFGNAAHLIAQIAIYQGRELFAFTGPGDKTRQEAARNWALSGLAAPMKCRRRNSMPPSCSHPSGRLFLLRCAR